MERIRATIIIFLDLGIDVRGTIRMCHDIIAIAIFPDEIAVNSEFHRLALLRIFVEPKIIVAKRCASVDETDLLPTERSLCPLGAIPNVNLLQ